MMGILVGLSIMVYVGGAMTALGIGLIYLFDDWDSEQARKDRALGYRLVCGGFLAWPLMLGRVAHERLAQAREEMEGRR
ncbi:hypothetical protein Q7C18_02935 [Nesterenkonia sp. CL21]|uniref:hypothetical protein n=1 Tax=Nesterenkonia sp. CL21 TaxID=3064894 RepID=UPI002879ACB2|nr:hypothetical protein [Nesterenkonia sp. CL21]MDS2171643.1 hypothetical protein [Nesterenkonia sp. CL21]